MTTSIADVRKAMADCLKLVEGLESQAYPIDTINPPCAHVVRKSMDPRTVFTGSTNVYGFGVVLYVSRTADEWGSATVDAYCEVSGARSIKAALEDEANWPTDLVHYVSVTQIGETAVTEVAGVQYLVVEFDIEVVW